MPLATIGPVALAIRRCGVYVLGMGSHCCAHDHGETSVATSGHRGVLWAVLAINVVMFAVE